MKVRGFRGAAIAALALSFVSACRSGGSSGNDAPAPGPACEGRPEAAGAAEEAGAGVAVDVPASPPPAVDAGTDPGPAPAPHPEPPEAGPLVAEGGFAPCGEPPEGMVCIPGGPFPRGSDRGDPDERPPAEVVVSTFHIDRYEVTNARYRRCMDAGACRLMRHYEGFDDPDQPVVAVDWFNAAAYCAWAGHRLPTEAEWEKAAGGADGREYPWGNEPPTCARAAYRGCLPDHTRPVGSFAPGAWNLHDMAGNAYEFVADWYSPCYRGCRGECGAQCEGIDPKGPCGGAPECPGRDKRVLRGGSWFWWSTWTRAANRRGMRPDAGGHRLGFRCAASAPAGTAGVPPEGDSRIPP